MSSKNISLTCRVECSPICSITWLKDGRQLDITNNPLYYTKTEILEPDLRTNDFESIRSTLVSFGDNRNKILYRNIFSFST